jgi:hypothetical protein
MQAERRSGELRTCRNEDMPTAIRADTEDG